MFIDRDLKAYRLAKSEDKIILKWAFYLYLFFFQKQFIFKFIGSLSINAAQKLKLEK
jgi:hypothetical protein